jgi:hypothetical protein
MDAAGCSRSGLELLPAGGDISEVANPDAEESLPPLNPESEDFNYDFSDPTIFTLLNDFLIKYGEDLPFLPHPPSTSSNLTGTSQPPGLITQPLMPFNRPQPHHNDPDPAPSHSTSQTHPSGPVSSHSALPTPVTGVPPLGQPSILHSPSLPMASMLPAPTTLLSQPMEISQPIVHSEQPGSSAPTSLPVDTAEQPHAHPQPDKVELPHPNELSSVAQSPPTLLSGMEPRTELPPKNPSLVQQPPAILVDTQGEAMLPPITAFVEPPTKRKRQPSKHNEEANSIGNKAGRSKKRPAAASSANSGPSKYMVDPMPLAITIRLIRKNKIK